MSQITDHVVVLQDCAWPSIRVTHYDTVIYNSYFYNDSAICYMIGLQRETLTRNEGKRIESNSKLIPSDHYVDCY